MRRQRAHYDVIVINSPPYILAIIRTVIGLLPSGDEVTLGEISLIVHFPNTQGLQWNALIARFMGPTWGPTWGRQGQGGPYLGHVNLAIWVVYQNIQILISE